MKIRIVLTISTERAPRAKPAEPHDGPPFIFDSSGTLVESAPRVDHGDRDPIRMGFQPRSDT